MKKLLDAVTVLVADTHPSKIGKLASLIRESDEKSTMMIPRGWGMTSSSKDRLTDLFNSWRSTQMSADELAGMLVGASHAYHQAKAEESIELVWTGPSSELVAIRKTEQALLEVIRSAREELFLTSFVAYKVESVMKALSKALDRDVAVSMLLESSDQHGGSISVDTIAQMRRSLPTAKIYYWSTKEGGFSGGKVHAKVAVADSKTCFISSANLTGHAMEKNMEAGVLIRGGGLPEQLHKHLKAMVVIGVVSSSF